MKDHTTKDRKVRERAPSVIDLLRHGATEAGAVFCGKTDARLTAEGWQQLWQAVAETDPGWELIISSPLSRCRDFAHQLACRLKLPLRIEKDLQEMDFGAWEGRSAAELMETDAEALGRFWSDPLNNAPPQAESLADFQSRVLGAWQNILTDCSDQNLLLVTHGGVIRTLLCHIRNRPIEKLLEFEVKHGALLRVEEEQAGTAGYSCGPQRYRIMDPIE